MCYTKPVVERVEQAISVFRQQSSSCAAGKLIDGGYLDIDFYACTIGAYEVDE